ncbi:MAG: hypothetical protein KAT43_00170 [Nanoarchaeota archaeon]|nr:hypothetical protein [Nanoarchaeota archaeon]
MNRKNRQAQVALFIVIGMVLVISASILIYYEYLYNGTSEPHIVQLDLCPDDTVFEACSYDKPLFCAYDSEIEELALVKDCTRCGCPEGMACMGSSCEEIDNKQDFPFTIFFVPLNYEPDDSRFISRVNEIKEELKLEFHFPDTTFVILDEQLETDAVCDIDLGAVSLFAEDWYLEKNDKFLPAPAPYRYRIFAIDKLLQDVDECGCGFTYLYGDAIYLGGQECSQRVNVADHEFGHTFGLCDEYDTCVWEATNGLSRCKNKKPNALNSDCGNECCSAKGACCNGKYSDSGFNVMGSADLPDERDFNYESSSVIGKNICQTDFILFLCEMEI